MKAEVEGKSIDGLSTMHDVIYSVKGYTKEIQRRGDISSRNTVWVRGEICKGKVE